MTQVLELRDASMGIMLLLDRDAAAVRTGRIHTVRAALPMPEPPKLWRDQWRRWPVVKGLPVARERGDQV